MQHLPKHNKWISLFVVLLIIAGIATPVLAEYLGPNRRVTTTVPYCRWTKYRCAQQKNNKWEYHSVDSWLCSNEGKPWEGCSGNSPSCSKTNDGHTYCERHEGTETIVVDNPPATIAGAVQNCTSQNNWCNSATLPELALSAREPLDGYNILLIEGTLNGLNFACQGGATSCIIPSNSDIPWNEGENTFNYWALSSWGDSSLMGVTTVRLDTVAPDVGLNISGTSGSNGWYVSPITVTAAPSDATSGVATFEVAVDGAAYQPYNAPLSFGDGYHTVQFRASDNAGNQMEAAQPFNVDTVPPTVHLPHAWQLGRNVDYSVSDEGSGVGTLRVVIEDEDEHYKLAWDEESAAGAHYEQDINWNGQFKDKTVAPPGTYLVWVKASDVAGNETFELGRVIVPEPNYVGAVVLPTAASSAIPPAPPAELAAPTEAVSLNASQPAAAGGTGTSTYALTLSGATGSAGRPSSATTTSSGILWGSVAAAIAGAVTSYALGVSQKRKEEEEAQAAAVRAQVAHDKAERAENHMTKEDKAKRAEEHDRKVQERKEQQSWENPAKEKAKLKQQEQAYQQWLQQQADLVPPDGIPTYAQSVYVHGGPPIPPEKALSPDQLQFVRQQEQKKKEEKKEADKRQADKVAMLAGLPNYSADKQYVVPQTSIGPKPAEPTLRHPGPRGPSLPGADFAAEIVQKVQDFSAKVVQGVQDFSVKVLKKVDEGKETVKQWAQTKYEEAKDTVKTTIEQVKKTLNEPYGYLKKLNPPSWLSISGGASVLDRDLFSSDYIGVSSGTGGLWKRYFYETQTIKHTVSVTGTRNPGGFVDLDFTEGKFSIDFGDKVTVSAKALTTEFAVTVKQESNDPYHYAENVYGLDYGWMSSSWITARNEVQIDPTSTSDLEIKTVNTVEGKARTLKAIGPVMVIVLAAAAVAGWQFAPVIAPILEEFIRKGILSH